PAEARSRPPRVASALSQHVTERTALMSELSGVVQAFYDRWAAGELDESRALFAPDAVITTPAGTMDLDAHQHMGRAFKAAFPDSHMETSRMVSVGNDVWVTGRFKGTQTGDLVGEQGTIAASGKQIDLPFAEVFTIRDDLIARQETYWDQMTMLAQIGALP